MFSSLADLSPTKAPKDLFAEGRELMEQAIMMYAAENPDGFTNAAINAELDADPGTQSDQRGWITYKYILALCEKGRLERVEVFDSSNEPLTSPQRKRAEANFLKRFECDALPDVPETARNLFLSTPRVQRQYLRPLVVYRAGKFR